MRAETPEYKAERLKWTTKPRYYLRPAYVRKSGDVTEYPFQRDLASHRDVDASIRAKHVCVKTISGAARQADPISNRSSIAFLEVQLGGEAARRLVADPARPLQQALTAIATPTLRQSWPRFPTCAANEPALVLQVDNITGYPDKGTLKIDSEDFIYDGRDLATNTFQNVYPASRDTQAAAHVVAARVRNGEVLRRGTRLGVYVGYAPMAEDDYMLWEKLEVTSLETQNFNTVVVFRCSDIQRFTKRKVFEGASQINPAVLGPDHPITLGLKVLTSTGLGSNGPYDMLAKELGAAVPYQLIDIEGLEQLRAHPDIANFQLQFNEIAAQDAKDWIETQIFAACGILPDVNQAGQYTGRLLTTPDFADGANMGKTFHAVA